MKKLISLMLVVFMLFTLIGCTASTATTSVPQSTTSTSQSTTTATTAVGAKPLIVYVCDGFSDRFSNWLVESMKKEVSEKFPGYELRVLDGKFDDSVQAEQMENAISMKPEVIIFNQHAPLVCVPQQRAAQEAGITVINCQSPFLDEKGEIMAPYVDADMYVIGKMIAEYAMPMIPKDAKAAILHGPANNVHSGARDKGWKEVLKTRPDIKILDEQIANWRTDEGMRIAEDWYQANPDLSVIIAYNDNMALGAIEAAKAINKTGLLAFGVDGMIDACYSVKKGELKGTVLQNAPALAAAAVELADRAIKGEKLKVEDSIHTAGQLITPDNVDEFIKMHEGK